MTNVLLIVVDALRVNNLGCYGYNKNTSPTIDGLANKGIMFTKAFGCGVTTDQVLTSIYSGMYPFHHGIINHRNNLTKKELSDFKKKNIPFLQDILNDNGYKTYGFDMLTQWFSKGFYKYYNYGKIKRSFQKKSVNLLKRIKIDSLLNIILKKIPKFFYFLTYNNTSKEMTNKVIEIIKKEKNKFFIFLHYWNTHAPYPCDSKYEKEFNDGFYSKLTLKDYTKELTTKLSLHYDSVFGDNKTMDSVIAKYNSAIRTVDSYIGSIIKTLKINNKLNNTLIIITADHGEMLTEHNILFDHHTLYEPIIHVPLILYYPKKLKPKIEDKLTQNIDIFSTVLKLLNIKIPNNLDSIDILNNKRSFIYAEENYYGKRVVLRDLNYKYILSKNKICGKCDLFHGNEKELYNIKTDINEQFNIINENPEVHKKMELSLNNLLNKWPKQQMDAKIK